MIFVINSLVILHFTSDLLYFPVFLLFKIIWIISARLFHLFAGNFFSILTSKLKTQCNGRVHTQGQDGQMLLFPGNSSIGTIMIDILSVFA